MFKKDLFREWCFYVMMITLFNPVYEIHFTRLVWNAIDVCLAVVLLAGAAKTYIDQSHYPETT